MRAGGERGDLSLIQKQRFQKKVRGGGSSGPEAEQKLLPGTETATNTRGGGIVLAGGKATDIIRGHREKKGASKR